MPSPPLNPTNKTSKQVIPYRYFELFALKMLGVPYPKMALQTGYNLDHIKWLFSKNGTLYEYWRQWVEEKRENNIQEALDMMWGHLPDIVRADISLALNPASGAGGSIARERIMNYVLGKPEERLRLSGKVGVVVATMADFTSAVYEQWDREKSAGKPVEVVEPDTQNLAERPDQVLP